MTRCERCSRGPRSLYHVGPCPKAPRYEILEIPCNRVEDFTDVIEWSRAFLASGPKMRLPSPGEIRAMVSLFERRKK